jgi:hypothetical protein
LTVAVLALGLMRWTVGVEFSGACKLMNFCLRIFKHWRYMDTIMFKEALICGFGMVFDLSGSSYAQSQAGNGTTDGIASDWKQVGSALRHSIEREGPKIKDQAAKQLDLKLG